jgi:16S rRNA processing protein RimM
LVAMHDSPPHKGEGGRILIARIVAAHGIKGHVKVTSSCDSLASYKVLQDSAGRRFDVTKLVVAKDHFIATLKGVTDRNQAEALKGVELFVPRDALPEAHGETYLADLVGRSVMHNSSVLGVILGFQNFGAGELMELDDGTLIPVRFLDAETMTVDLPDGFMDKS